MLLKNLLENAIQHSHAGGVVTRQVQRAELKLWRTGISKQLLSPAGTENRLNLFLVHLEPGGNTGDGNAEENTRNQRRDAACRGGRLGIGRAGCLILRHKSLPEEKDLYAAKADWEISFRHIRARRSSVLSP